jgi:hypothetical protein
MKDDRWPDYCKKATLARRLDLPVGAIDQMVKRGLLPPPVSVDDAMLWRWETVDSFLKEGKTSGDSDDPYILGAQRAAQAAAARRPGQKQNRTPVLLSDPQSGN